VEGFDEVGGGFFGTVLTIRKKKLHSEKYSTVEGELSVANFIDKLF
jgi:hypothetical protein